MQLHRSKWEAWSQRNNTTFLMRPICNQHHSILPLWHNHIHLPCSKLFSFCILVLYHIFFSWTNHLYLCKSLSTGINQFLSIIIMLLLVDFKLFRYLWCIHYICEIVFNFHVVIWNWISGSCSKFKRIIRHSSKKWRGDHSLKSILVYLCCHLIYWQLLGNWFSGNITTANNCFYYPAIFCKHFPPCWFWGFFFLWQ